MCTNSARFGLVIPGSVSERGEPLVRISLISSNRRSSVHPAVIDTGFNGALSLPEPLARRCRWRWIGYESYEIATGDIVQEKVFLGNIRWFGRVQEVYAVASHAKDILIGTQLLRHKRLIIDFRAMKLRIL